MSASLNDRPNKVTVVDESVTVTAGAGVQGAQGDPGIVISATEPDETDVLWADTSAAGSMVVPAGGTSGQVLAKASGDDYDSEWVTPAASGIPATLLDAKGDLIVASAADTAARLAIGTDGQTPTVNSNATTGISWGQGGLPLYAGSASWHQGLGQNFLAVQTAATPQVASWSPILVYRRMTVAALGTYCGTGQSGAEMRLGIYASSINATVGALVADYGAVSGASIGAKTVSGSTVLDPGLFFICAWASNHTTVRWVRPQTIQMYTLLYGDNLPGNGRLQWCWFATADYSAGLPANPPTLTIGDNFSTNYPIGMMRFS